MTMRVLVVEDDGVSRCRLTHTLSKWGYDVVSASNGTEAWEILQRADAPPLAIVDWMMPGMGGLEVCRRVRGDPRLEPTYLILLTARNAKGDAVAGPLLVSKGHEVSEPLLQRLRNFSLNGTVREPIKVYRS